MIQIQNLSKSYFLNKPATGSNEEQSQGEGQKLEILKNLNFTLAEGEVVAIVGASGSGKSTLLALLAGLDQPTSGDIILDQQSLKKLSRDEMTYFRSEKIGIIFQQYHLVSHLTAYENVILPLEILNRPIDHQKIKVLFERVGLSTRQHHLPSELSGGECQRVAMARALAVDPKLILADEPSGSLDQETGQKVMDLFFEQVKAQKTTTILVTHDLELAQRCDRILKLNHGELKLQAEG